MSDDIACLQLPTKAYGPVNAWILGRRGNQAIVDTGMPGQETADLWQKAEADGLVAGVRAVLCTHMHIDHVGQAGPLTRRFGAPLLMSQGEHDDLLTLSGSSAAERAHALEEFLHRAGFSDSEPFGPPVDYGVLGTLPTDYICLQEGAEIELGGISFEVMLGGGHSLAPVCLLSRQESLFIAGDQILAGLGPQLALQPEWPERDPLGDYFAFLDSLSGLPDDLVVLPGHGAPFTGLPAQIARIRDSHVKRLARLVEGMDRPSTCAQMALLAFPSRSGQRLASRLPFLIAAMANHLFYRGILDRHIDDLGTYRFEVTAKARDLS